MKSLSESGRLAEYAILHFATHGALAGQMLGNAEPGLILTPPETGTDDPTTLERRNLGALYVAQGRFTDAEARPRRCLIFWLGAWPSI